MDSKLKGRFDNLDLSIEQLKAIVTRDATKTKVNSGTATLSASTVTLPMYGKKAGVFQINFTTQQFIGTIPSFIRLMLNQAGTLKYYHVNDAQVKTWEEAITANIAVVVKREGWYAVEITPSAYSATLTWYASSDLPAIHLEIGEVLK